MTGDLPCSVCGERVYFDDTHVVVQVETRRPDDRDEIGEYFIHWQCRDAVLGGWSKP